MASNSFGHIFKFTSFGESHGKAIGCIIDELLYGLCIYQEGQSVTSDRYKKPKLRRYNALVSLHFHPKSDVDFI